MHFHHGGLYGLYRIPDSHRSMGISRGIQDDAVPRKADLLDLADDLAFDIGMEMGQFHLGELLLQLCKKTLKGGTSIYFWFPFSQKAQIGTVDDHEFHGR